MNLLPPPKAKLIELQGSLEEQRRAIFFLLFSQSEITIFIDCLGRVSKAQPPPYHLPFVLHIHQQEHRIILSMLQILKRILCVKHVVVDPINAVETQNLGVFINLLRTLHPSLQFFLLIERKQHLLIHTDIKLITTQLLEVHNP